MIKNDVLVQLPDCTFWFSEFKWLLLQEETIKIMLIDNSWFELDANNKSLIEACTEYQQIIHDAWIEYEKRNREYVIAMNNDGVLPATKPISAILGKTVYYQDGTCRDQFKFEDKVIVIDPEDAKYEKEGTVLIIEPGDAYIVKFPDGEARKYAGTELKLK